MTYHAPPRSYAQRLAEEGSTENFRYKANQAFETLKPYQGFLKRVREYYNKNSQSVRWREAPPGYARGAGRDGFWADIDDEPVMQKIGEGEIKEVYEFDPEADLPRYAFAPGNKIEITGHSADEMLVHLKRRPKKPVLRIRPNLAQISQELRAIDEISNNPRRPEHDGLLMLLHRNDFVDWPGIEEIRDPEWRILTEDREGAGEQRRFVKTAMATPDFALLSGPPGSGKTTAICELVLQLASEGRRMLFCASTHVAIDNLLERLVDGGAPAKNLLPIRIGNSPKISDLVRPYFYDNFVKTKTDAMEKRLKGLPRRTESQAAMLDSLRDGDTTVGEMVRRYANLVCGTPIGILQYFKKEPDARFDYLIVDEASKTTFHEFLVPALHAGRWVIVGDTRQLVPHTDQDEIAANVNACLDARHANACLDAFAAKKYGNATILVAGDAALREVYGRQCEARDVRMDAGGELGYGRITACAAESVPALLARSRTASEYARGRGVPPRRRVVVRDYDHALDDVQKTSSTKPGLRILDKILKKQQSYLQEYTWGHELGWRISIHQPQVQGRQGDKHEDIEALMPADGAPKECIDDIKRVALPSVLELMQQGYDREGRDAALAQGLPRDAFDARHVLLSYQHRMHPDIARFPHKYMYDEQALKSPPDMAEKREWRYDRYPGRCAWIDVKADDNAGPTRDNRAEAQCIAGEIHRFISFANKNPKMDGTPWEVAVLCFYTRQRNMLQGYLRSIGSGPYTFRIPPSRPRVTVSLRTVDSFQGHESDIVFITMTKPHPTSFLNNPNRLNVALTRARYQCVIVGDPRLKRGDPPLARLAGETPRMMRG